jgi:hypothetical protein
LRPVFLVPDSGSVYVTALALRTLDRASRPRPDEGPPPDEPEGASVQGRVLDAATGSPIPSARIELSAGDVAWVGHSGGDGRFRLAELDAGDYEIDYRAAGYLPASQQVQLGEHTALSLGDIHLQPLPDVGSVRGRVTAAATGEPLAEATVSISGPDSVQLSTDADGRYGVELAPGEYQIEIGKEGFRSVLAAGELGAGVSWLLSPALAAVTDDPIETATLRGRVQNPEGVPLAAVQIDAGDGLGTATAGDGTFRLENVPPGERTLVFERDGYLGLALTADLPAAPELDLGTVVMEPLPPDDPGDDPDTVLHGVVSDGLTGQPLGGVMLEIGDLRAFSGADGRYRFEDPPAGVQVMTASLAGYRLRSLTVEIPATGAHVLDVTLFPAGAGTVRVRNPVTSQPAYAAWREVEAAAELENIGAEAQTVIIYGQIFPMAESRPIADFPAIEVPVGGDVSDAHVRVEPDERVPVALNWFVEDIAPGRYRFRIQALDAFDGQLAHEAEAVFDVEPTRFVERVELRAVPAFAVIGADIEFDLDILITHRSNEDTPLAFDWRLLDPDDAPVLDGSFATSLVPAENHLRFFAQGGPIDLTRSGEYRLEVTAFSEGEPLAHGAQSLFVASGVRLEIEDVAAPDTVTPEDGRRIERRIRLEGVEEK